MSTPWTARSALATVVVLIFLLGGTLSAAAPADLLRAIPYAVGLVVVVMALTVAVARLLGHRPGKLGSGPARFPIYVPIFLAALVVGYALGRAVPGPYATALPWSLYVLLFLVAFDLRLNYDALRHLGAPLASAAIGAVGGALLFGLAVGMNLQIALASGLGFGWYSLAGPLVAARFGAAAGLIAFLSNFLREDLTMILAPEVGPRVGAETLTAMGGATTMDTTLFFVTRYGDRNAGSLALASGLILTVAASILIPVVLGAP